MKRARHKRGSVVLNRRSKTWHFLWCEDGHRRSKLLGNKQNLPTKADAWREAEKVHAKLVTSPPTPNIPSVKMVVERYRTERFPKRLSTSLAYTAWINNHIIPHWGDTPITDLKPRAVELWLRQLNLAPKSKVHIRTLLRILLDYAMWCGVLEVGRNPMELVIIRGASQRSRQPRSLSVDEFSKLLKQLNELVRIMARIGVCFGLRASELLGLKWRDIDWAGHKLRVERGIVRQTVDDVKTASSRKAMAIAEEVLALLRQWKQKTQFSAEEDWIFASPTQLGRLPWSYPWLWRELHDGAIKAGIGPVGVHTLRHTYRAWLDAVGTGIAVQQKLMRHTDIRTTLNIYGDVVTDEMAEAQGKVAGLALGLPN